MTKLQSIAETLIHFQQFLEYPETVSPEGNPLSGSQADDYLDDII